MNTPDHVGVAGIVLAGGGSTRFGRDKLAEPLEGRPLLEHAITALQVVCDDVVVVAAPGADHDGLPGGIRVVHDRVAGEGPLAGLQEGLLAVVSSDLAIVAGGDMPRLKESVLRLMLEAMGSQGVSCVALEGPSGDGLPLPLALRTWPAAEATHTLLHAGARALRDLLEALQPEVVPQAMWRELDPAGLTILDVDEPSDLP